MADNPSIGDYLGGIAQTAPKIIGDLKDLAGTEIKPAAKHAGIGAGMFGGAAGVAYFVLKLLIFTLGFLFAWLYAKLGLSILMALFCGFMTTVVLGLVLVGILALLGKSQFGKVHGPEQTMAEVNAMTNQLSAAVTTGSTLANMVKEVDYTPEQTEVLMHFVTDPVYRPRRKEN